MGRRGRVGSGKEKSRGIKVLDAVVECVWCD